jgi:regulator of protease activity HflC (stomatin/prohibitin superfamily)
MNSITVFLVITCALIGLALGETVDILLAPAFLAAAVIIALSLKMANAWQKFVVLRSGKLQSVKGPGLFLIFPIIDKVVAVIDERIKTTAFNAEQALTEDAVPVNVDAIILWHDDARKAALEITDYGQAIDRVAQTSLREMIGSSDRGHP